jgi:D-sedoheptulose 7-phosphate isomerase
MRHTFDIFDNSIEKFASAYFDNLHALLTSIDLKKFECFIEEIVACIDGEKGIFFAGNGGSASTASHFVTDLIVCTKFNGTSVRVNSLCDNGGLLTAIANDYGYQYVFSKQIENMGQAGDLLVLISGSGNSDNLLEAAESAKRKGMNVFGLLGFEGGALGQLLQKKLIVPALSGDYGPVEDAHLIMNHITSTYLRLKYAST